jgi:hypothetical protein
MRQIVAVVGSSCQGTPTHLAFLDMPRRPDQLLSICALAWTMAACSSPQNFVGDASPSEDASAGLSVPDGSADAAPCLVVAPTSCTQTTLRYKDVEPIFSSRCVLCHYGAFGGPWPLTTYGHVSDWRATIRDSMIACSMPPVDADKVMPNEERHRILEWLRCGLPQ